MNTTTVILASNLPDLRADCVRVGMRGQTAAVDAPAEELQDFLTSLAIQIGPFNIVENMPPDTRASQMVRRGQAQPGRVGRGAAGHGNA